MRRRADGANCSGRQPRGRDPARPPCAGTHPGAYTGADSDPATTDAGSAPPTTDAG
jgi:hypothetical protein